MQLVIVESPTKTKSLGKYLGKGFIVKASMGHLRDLPKSKMGVEVKKEGKKYVFEPEYITVRGKGKQVKELTKAASAADKVILAMDPDREGEAIAHHVAVLLGLDGEKKKDKVSRVVFHSITKDEVLKAMEKPRGIDVNLYDAQQARRVLDRLVGYKISPVLWRKVRTGLSAGRVQSVALRMIVEREREIEAFKADEYWLILVDVKGEKGAFTTELKKIAGKKAEVKDEKTATEVEEDLKTAKLKIQAVEKKERRAWAKPPYKTSTLQQAAANVLGWQSKKTMQVAQKLYEQGNITYHRTDSLNLAPVAISAIREFVKKEFGENYLTEKEKVFKTRGKVVAQEAHEAIRPADMSVGTNSFAGKGKYGGDQEKLYGLIWRRTIATQMMPAVFDATRVVVEAKGKKTYELTATGEVQKFDGWRKLYSRMQKDYIELPEVKEGEALELKEVKKEQKFTQPPPRYNDASLVKELEKRGIGRPSTYASIISTLLNRAYINREDRRFFATKMGVMVGEFLMKNFPTELDYEFTAKMEDGLDDIADGKLEWQKYMSDFYGPFEGHVEDVLKNAERVEIPVERTGQTCPDCKQGEIVIREGRFGRFYSCERFPECKYTANFKEYLEGEICPDDGGKVVIKKTRRGKVFYGCENYPKCKWATWNKPGEKKEGEEENEVDEGGKDKE